MDNHFHLVVETPRANLVVGMRWFLGTYTTRFTRAALSTNGRAKSQFLSIYLALCRKELKRRTGWRAAGRPFHLRQRPIERDTLAV
jgi:hypothetical protein